MLFDDKNGHPVLLQSYPLCDFVVLLQVAQVNSVADHVHLDKEFVAVSPPSPLDDIVAARVGARDREGEYRVVRPYH